MGYGKRSADEVEVEVEIECMFQVEEGCGRKLIEVSVERKEQNEGSRMAEKARSITAQSVCHEQIDFHSPRRSLAIGNQAIALLTSVSPRPIILA